MSTHHPTSKMMRYFHDRASRPLRSGWSKAFSVKLPMMLALVLLLTSCQLTNDDTTHITPQASGGQDWPMFLHDPARTAASDETILSPSNAGQLKKLWAFKTGGPIAASAAIVAGVVYVGSWDGYEYALDARTGAMKWKTFLGINNKPACAPPVAGVSSGAEVQDDVVYVGGGDDYWYALDAKTGKILWKVFTGDTDKGYYNWSSPLLYKGYAYIGTSSFGDCPLVQGQLLKVSLKTHQIVKTLNFVPNGQVGGGLWSSPAVDTATDTIFAATGTGDFTQPLTQAVLAIDAATLAVKDLYKVPEGQTLPDSSDFGGTVRLFQDADGRPLLADINKDGYLYAFNRYKLAAGPIWRRYIACATGWCGYSAVSTGTFGDGRLYYGGGNTVIDGKGYQGSVRALDPATGKLLWEHGITGIGAGLVVGPLAYTNGLVMGGAGSIFEILDAATGTALYSYETGDNIYAAPSISHGQIFIGSTDGNLYSFGLG